MKLRSGQVGLVVVRHFQFALPDGSHFTVKERG